MLSKHQETGIQTSASQQSHCVLEPVTALWVFVSTFFTMKRLRFFFCENLSSSKDPQFSVKEHTRAATHTKTKCTLVQLSCVTCNFPREVLFVSSKNLGQDLQDCVGASKDISVLCVCVCVFVFVRVHMSVWESEVGLQVFSLVTLHQIL